MLERLTRRLFLIGTCGALAVACSKTPQDRPAETAAPSVGGDGHPMDGMQGRMPSGPDSASGNRASTNGLSPEVDSQLRTMMSADAATMRTLVPSHRQMVANALAGMNSEMRQMHMTADPGWTALVDSIRQDLVVMPEQDGEALRSMMPAHAARVRQLGVLHAGMMSRMK